MAKKKARVKRDSGRQVDGQAHSSPDMLDEGDESVATMHEWRRLRGLKNRLSAALHTLDRESTNGPIAFEHFLAKCRAIAGYEAE
jgi:hypothetical protein